MSKLPLIAATAALGLFFVAGTTRTVTAAEVTPYPSDGQNCWYKLYHCSYDGDAYWSKCDPNFGEGWIPTGVARQICRQFQWS